MKFAVVLLLGAVLAMAASKNVKRVDPTPVIPQSVLNLIQPIAKALSGDSGMATITSLIPLITGMLGGAGGAGGIMTLLPVISQIFSPGTAGK